MCHMLFSLPHDILALPIAMWHRHMPLPHGTECTATAMWQKEVTTPPQELVPTNAAINVNVYCQQLECLNNALKKKRLVLRKEKGLF